jgi:uncharacterized protein YbjT (DUF2867 family)
MKILVVGGSGLVGRELLKELQNRTGNQVTSLVRKIQSDSQTNGGISERVFDFNSEQSYAVLSQERFDIVFCCLGTTRKKAGSAEAFRLVDLDYPRKILAAVKDSTPVFALISSVGADTPKGLYLQTKAELEAAVQQSGLRFVIVRPSLLLGERSEFRLGERIATLAAKPLASIMAHHLGEKMANYAPVSAKNVAHALVRHALELHNRKEGRILQGRAILG